MIFILDFNFEILDLCFLFDRILVFGCLVSMLDLIYLKWKVIFLCL